MIRPHLATPVQPERRLSRRSLLLRLPVLDSLRRTAKGNFRRSTNRIPAPKNQQNLKQQSQRLSPSQTQSLAISLIAGKDPTSTLFARFLNRSTNRHVLFIICTYNVSSRLFQIFILLPSILITFSISVSIDINMIRNSRFHVHHRIVFLKIGHYLVILFLDYVQSGGRVAFQGLLYSFSIAF